MDSATTYPEDRSYSSEHEWLRADSDGSVLGITVFAQEELGDVVFVELPEVGQRFEAGAEIGTIESVKAVAELYTPIGGEILEINEKVLDSPELVNEDPHGEGWLIKIKVDPEGATALMTAAEYQKLLAQG